MVKKPAIEARQGHPTGIIDDAGKAIGKAMKKTKSAGSLVSDVASDRYARTRYYTIPRAVDKMAGRSGWTPKQPAKNVKLDARVIRDEVKRSKNWMMPDGTLEPKRKAKKLLKQEKARVSKKYGTK